MKMKHPWKRLGALILVLSMVLSMAACSSGDDNTTTDGTDGTTASGIKEEIVIARPEDSNNLDPVLQDGNVNIWIFTLVMEPLLRTTDDGTGVEPCLAKSFEVSDDGKTYTFTMEDGLVFSNGDPVLAEDLVWSYERAMTTEDSIWLDLVSNLDSVEAPNDTTFVVHLKEASPAAEPTFTLFNLVIGDKSYFEEVGVEEYSKHPVGTGAYQFTEWKQGEYLLLSKNPNYRDVDNVKTERIRFTVVPDDNTRVMQLQSGDVDMITFVPYNRLDELAADPNLQIATPESTEVRVLELNCVNGPTADVRVRQAIAMGVDKEAIVKTVLFGYGTEATSFLPTALPYAVEVETHDYDPEGAKALLAEAGYADGLSITLTTVSGNTNYEQIATLVKEQLSQIGVDVTIELLEAGTFNARRAAVELEMFLGGWTSDIGDPSQQCGYYCLPSMANCVHTGWSNDEVITMVTDATHEMDTEVRADLYKQVQEIYADEVPTIPLYYTPFPVAMSKNVTGFAQTPLGNYRFNNLAATVE